LSTAIERQPPAEWLASIQVMRGLAALSVVFYHSINAAHRADPSIARIPFLQAGVDLFFIISGFVMVHVTRDKVGKPGAAREFLRNRIIRVVPLYWTYTTFMIVLLALFPSWFRSEHLNLSQALASYFFWPDRRGPFVQVGWTLNFEMFFYVCFALGFDRAWKRYGLLIPGLFLGGLWGVIHPTQVRTGLVALAGSPFLLEFLSGMLVGYAYHGRYRPPAWLGPVGLAVCLILFAGFRVHAHRMIEWGLPLLFLFITGLGFEQRLRTGTRPLLWLGDVSYSLYLSHFFTVSIMEKLWVTRFHAAQPRLFIPVTAAVCVIVVYPLWRWLEQPLLRGCRKLWKRRREPDSVSVAA
jgi:peptidoglycan/LPS O-acetylase OafA/YrhL